MTPEAPDIRSRILRTALTLFSRYGYAGTSVRRIAEESGLTKAGLYYHFEDKASLFHAAISDTAHYLETKMVAHVKGVTDPAARVRGLLHAQVVLFEEEGHLLRVFYNNLFLTDVELPEFKDSSGSTECLMEEALQDCANHGLIARNIVAHVHILLGGGIELCGARWLIDKSQPAPTRELADQLLLVAAPKIAEAAGIQEPLPTDRQGGVAQ